MKNKLPKFNEDTWAAYVWVGCCFLCLILPFIIYYTNN